jgi:hypothetical protein
MSSLSTMPADAFGTGLTPPVAAKKVGVPIFNSPFLRGLLRVPLLFYSDWTVDGTDRRKGADN